MGACQTDGYHQLLLTIRRPNGTVEYYKLLQDSTLYASFFRENPSLRVVMLSKASLLAFPGQYDFLTSVFDFDYNIRIHNLPLISASELRRQLDNVDQLLKNNSSDYGEDC
jgi:hypothetical protein